MKGPRRETLDPELEALLNSERLALPPADSLDRVWMHVQGSLAWPFREAPRAEMGRGSGDVQVSIWTFRQVAAISISTFALGAVAGAGSYAAWVRASTPHPVASAESPRHAATVTDPSASRSIASDPPVDARGSSGVTPTNPVDGGESPPTEPRSARVRPSQGAPSHALDLVSSAPGRAPGSSLAAERAMLDRAQQALGAGDAKRALELTDQHARAFAHPQLVEEREALAIQALVLDGRFEDARARGARFRDAFPASLLLPAVDVSLSSIP